MAQPRIHPLHSIDSVSCDLPLDVYRRITVALQRDARTAHLAGLHEAAEDSERLLTALIESAVYFQGHRWGQ